MTMTFFLAVLNAKVRDNSNFYASVTIQYLTYFIKKVSENYLEYRIRNNLQYDDITLMYIMAVISEYIFIFSYILIQNNSRL